MLTRHPPTEHSPQWESDSSLGTLRTFCSQVRAMSHNTYIDERMCARRRHYICLRLPWGLFELLSHHCARVRACTSVHTHERTQRQTLVRHEMKINLVFPALKVLSQQMFGLVAGRCE